MKNRGLAEIKLLDPMVCNDCRFAKMAIVETSQGTAWRPYCQRGDCDNWGDIGSAEPVRLVRIYGEGSSDLN